MGTDETEKFGMNDGHPYSLFASPVVARSLLGNERDHTGHAANKSEVTPNSVSSRIVLKHCCCLLQLDSAVEITSAVTARTMRALFLYAAALLHTHRSAPNEMAFLCQVLAIAF